MSQTVNVPGVGTLQFPDGMSQADMAAAIKKNFPEIHDRASPIDKKAYFAPEAIAARRQAEQDKMVANMSTFQKIAAGAGKAVHDTGQGLGQIIGTTSKEDVARSRATDAALMRTGAGKTGNVLGYGLEAVPVALATPAAATAGGATLAAKTIAGGISGAAQGYASPYTSTGEHVANTLTGAGLGAVLPGAGSAASKVARGTANFFQHFTAPESVAAKNLARILGNNPGVIQKLKSAAKYVPGETPTTAQTLRTPEAVAAEKAIRNNPKYAAKFTELENGNNEARLKVLRDLAGDDNKLEDAVDARRAATEPFIKKNLSPSQPSIRWSNAAKPIDEALGKNMVRDQSWRALNEAKTVIQKVKNGALQEDDATEELEHIKATVPQGKALDALNKASNHIDQNMIDPKPVLNAIAKVRYGSLGTNPTVNKSLHAIENQIKDAMNIRGKVGSDLLDGIRQNASRILADNHNAKSLVGSQEEAGIAPIKKQITDMLEKAVPGYREYLKTYAEKSAPINVMQTARGILEPVDSGALNSAGQGKLTLPQINRALRQDAGARYGMDANSLAKVEGVQKSLQRESVSNSLRVPGSDTNYNAQAQNALARHLLGPTLGGPTPAGRAAAMAVGGAIGHHLGGVGATGLGVAAGSALGKVSNLANQRILDAYGRGLLDPREAAAMLSNLNKTSNPVTNYLVQLAQQRRLAGAANTLAIPAYQGQSQVPQQ